MRKRDILAVPAVGALAVGLAFGGPPRVKASQGANTGMAGGVSTMINNPSPTSQQLNKRLNKRGNLLIRKIPMPRAWHRR